MASRLNRTAGLLLLAFLAIIGSCMEGSLSGPGPGDGPRPAWRDGSGDLSTADGPVLTDSIAPDSTTLDSGQPAPDSGQPAPDSGPTGPVCDKTQHSGEGTYYDADGSGNCSFDPSTNLDVAAMNHTDYAGSAVCGACILIEGPQGQVTVRIVDRCPECLPGDVDLSQSAFAKMANVSAGRVPIQWHFVPCAVQGPIRYHFKEGSNQWWSAVQVRNHRHQIATFEALVNGTYKQIPRLDYNFFVDESGLGPGPYTFRVTDVYGQVLTDTNIQFVVGGEVAGSGQFPSCS